MLKYCFCECVHVCACSTWTGFFCMVFCFNCSAIMFLCLRICFEPYKGCNMSVEVLTCPRMLWPSTSCSAVENWNLIVCFMNSPWYSHNVLHTSTSSLMKASVSSVDLRLSCQIGMERWGAVVEWLVSDLCWAWKSGVLRWNGVRSVLGVSADLY